MSTKTPAKAMPTTSPFATKETTAKDVAALIAAALPLSTDGTIAWAKLPEAVRPFDVPGGKLRIGYSRAWLIVKRAWMEVNQPKLLVTLPEPTAAEVQAHGKNARNAAWSKVVSPMRDADQISWGEIAVRCGQPESKVRACYRATGAKKDLGLRIGKGGRRAFDDPELYLEHRRTEGAYIPATFKGRPTPEVLLNAKNAKGEVVRAQRAVAKKVGTKPAKKTVAA
jgi:hypothetical protein